jgi:hypothetical protein
MLTKVHEDCYVREDCDVQEEEIKEEIENRYEKPYWDFRVEKIDGTYFGSPFPVKNKVVFFTKGSTIPFKLSNFLYLPRTKTYWDTSLILSESKRGLTPNQIRSYRHFLFQNQDHVDSRVLIVRHKRSENLFCKVVKPGEDLPKLSTSLKSSNPWNVYDNKLNKTYDVDLERSVELVSKHAWRDEPLTSKNRIFDQLPNRFYEQLTNYLK